MKWAALALLAVCCGTANAESCSKSADYILSGSAGDLPQPAAAYRNLLKACLEALAMRNVQDAYVLKDGGIAIIPKQDNVAATAGTLAQFCDVYPRNILRFVTKREVRRGLTTALVVSMASDESASCRKIRGEQ